MTDALRDYLEAAAGIPARERTTTELRWSLPPALLEGARGQGFDPLFEEADLVKFARLRPTAAEATAFLGTRGRSSRSGATASVVARWSMARRRPLRPRSRGPMRFADPLWLLLLLVPAALAWTWWRRRRRAPDERIGFPGLAFLDGARSRAGAGGRGCPTGSG